MAPEPSEELDALISAIWGDESNIKPAGSDPELRADQNRALLTAIKAYLQSYLDDIARPT